MASPCKQRLAFKYSMNVEKPKLQQFNEEPVKAAAEHDLDSKLLQANAPAEQEGRTPHVISAPVVIDELHEAVQEDADTTTADYEHIVEPLDLHATPASNGSVKDVVVAGVRLSRPSSSLEELAQQLPGATSSSSHDLLLHATPGDNGSVKDVVVADGRPRSSIQLPQLSTTSSHEPEQQQIKDDVVVVVVGIDSVKRKIVIEAGKLMVRVLELVQDLQTEGPSTCSRMLENSKAAAAAHVVDVVVAADEQKQEEEKEEDREQLHRHEGAPISSCNAVMKSMHERANRDDDVAAAAVAVENLKSSLAQAMKFCDSEFSQLQTYSSNRTSPKRPLAEVSASGRLVHALSSLHRELQGNACPGIEKF
jgi:sRNA-binding carbon storage regulator CsrA